MSVELKIPEVGESVSEALISKWLKSVGEAVAKDEPVVELETDKITVELPSPVAGVLESIQVQEGETALVGDVVAMINEGATVEASDQSDEADDSSGEDDTPEPPPDPELAEEVRVMPAARRLLEQHGLDASEVEATGPGGRLLKEDVERHVEGQSDKSEPTAKGPEKPSPKPSKEPPTPEPTVGERSEDIVRMSPLRRRIAERLVGAQQSAALLTTFNEVDMSAVIVLRKSYQESFVKRHGVKLGFMSFFVKAAVDALRQFPQINAEVRDDQIVYRNYYDVGIAVSTDRGLMVPILRNAERMGFAEIEIAIGDFAGRARDGKIKLEELEGGTFTITNGGIFGSMLSTPIVNPPQSGVLGLHAIEERPIALDGEVVIHPMMYLALTYDHRIVDGREAVTFLRRIKETVEDPSRMLIEA